LRRLPSKRCQAAPDPSGSELLLHGVLLEPVAQRLEVDAVEQLVAALSGGAAQSWVLANRSGRMHENEYPLGFKVALHRKDLGIALQLARETGAALPVAAICEALEAGLVGRDHGDDDVSAVARVIRELSGLPG